MKSPAAQVHFNEQGTPVANHFDDVYFSNDSGIDETLHVFIEGNDLEARWQQHSESHFTIAETGFGTGLNCMVAMLAFERFRARNPAHPLKQLYITSCEKFPLAPDVIERALSVFPSVSGLSQTLLKQYPINISGCHRLSFDKWSTVIDIWLGDVHDVMPQWHSPSDGLIDAWFLDGFAPSKNPDMWSDTLFSQMARLSKPGATLATFTAAGFVKRGLQSVGFTMKKRKGFGRKRDMLTGQMAACQLNRQNAPCYNRYTKQVSVTDVAIVGGGLASACVALALTNKGVRVTLYHDTDALANGASGNPQGGFYPQLHAEASHPSQIQAHGFLFARRVYDSLLANDANFSHQWCGVAQLGFNDASEARLNKLAQAGIWPSELIEPKSKSELEQIANVELQCSGAFIKLGGWLSPPELVASIVNQSLKSGLLQVKPNHRLLDYADQSDGVRLEFCDRTPTTHEHLILACGHESKLLSKLQSLPMNAVRGQVEAIPSQPPLDALETVLCHKGYLTPGANGRHALGSTYVKRDMSCDVRKEESNANLSTHQKALSKVDWVNALQHDGKARAAIRLGAPDHQPIVGRAPDYAELSVTLKPLSKGIGLHRTFPPAPSNVSVFTGLGSRGLTTAPLMAEVLASELVKCPLPMPETLLHALHPSRFIVRDAIRGKLDDN